MSLFLGWRLFYRANDQADQSGSLTWRSFAFSFKRLGPGVLFALFGAITLAIALRSPLDIRNTNGAGGNSFRYLGGHRPVEALVALNNAYRISAFPVSEAISGVDREALAANKDVFDALRLTLAEQTAGKDDFYQWKTYRERLQTDPESIPEDHRDAVQRVQLMLEKWK